MPSPGRRLSHVEAINAEVVYGEAEEVRILKRWCKSSPRSKGGVQFVKGGAFCSYDYLVLDKAGLPLAYVEIKLRRSALDRYGDCIFPVTKTRFACAAWTKHAVPAYGVTEYGCGALVEVDLRTKPERIQKLTRRDRPGMGADHAYYAKSQLTVLATKGDT